MSTPIQSGTPTPSHAPRGVHKRIPTAELAQHMQLMIDLQYEQQAAINSNNTQPHQEPQQPPQQEQQQSQQPQSSSTNNTGVAVVAGLDGPTRMVATTDPTAKPESANVVAAVVATSIAETSRQRLRPQKQEQVSLPSVHRNSVQINDPAHISRLLDPDVGHGTLLFASEALQKQQHLVVAASSPALSPNPIRPRPRVLVGTAAASAAAAGGTTSSSTTTTTTTTGGEARSSNNSTMMRTLRPPPRTPAPSMDSRAASLSGFFSDSQDDDSPNAAATAANAPPVATVTTSTSTSAATSSSSAAASAILLGSATTIRGTVPLAIRHNLASYGTLVEEGEGSGSPPARIGGPAQQQRQQDLLQPVTEDSTLLLDRPPPPPPPPPPPALSTEQQQQPMPPVRPHQPYLLTDDQEAYPAYSNRHAQPYYTVSSRLSSVSSSIRPYNGASSGSSSSSPWCCCLCQPLMACLVHMAQNDSYHRSFCFGAIDGMLTGSGIVATFWGLAWVSPFLYTTPSLRLAVLCFATTACCADSLCMALGHIWTTHVVATAQAHERHAAREQIQLSTADAKGRLVDMLLTRGMLKIDAMSLADTLEGYPDLLLAALTGESLTQLQFGSSGGGAAEQQQEPPHALDPSTQPSQSGVLPDVYVDNTTALGGGGGADASSPARSPAASIFMVRPSPTPYTSYSRMSDYEMNPDLMAVDMAITESRRESVFMLLGFLFFAILPALIFYLLPMPASQTTKATPILSFISTWITAAATNRGSTTLTDEDHYPHGITTPTLSSSNMLRLDTNDDTNDEGVVWIIEPTSLVIGLTAVMMWSLGVWKSHFLDGNWFVFGMEAVVVLFICMAAAFTVGTLLSSLVLGHMELIPKN